MRLGWPEILLIIALVLIVFGVGKLPQVGTSLGKAIREFRSASRDLEEAHEDRSAKAVPPATKE